MLRAERAPWHQRFAQETRARGEGHGGPQLFEDRDAARKLLAELDPEAQQAAIHYFVDEMTLDEVAAGARALGADRGLSAWQRSRRWPGAKLPPEGGTK